MPNSFSQNQNQGTGSIITQPFANAMGQGMAQPMAYGQGMPAPMDFSHVDSSTIGPPLPPPQLSPPMQKAEV